MAFTKVATVAELGANSLLEVIVDGNCYALCSAGGAIYAISGVCLHRGGPLGEGALHGHNVVCPWHAWEWDCRTGANDYNPDQKVPTYPVRIEGGDVLIDIGQASNA